MVLAFSLAPPLLGAGIVHAFRMLITLETEKLVECETITAPAFTVGLHASEELARLDLDAEQLLRMSPPAAPRCRSGRSSPRPPRRWPPSCAPI